MKYNKIKSFAKINLSLNVFRKLKTGLHEIETLITFIKLSDDIFIKPIKKNNHNVFFYGKFSSGISKNNTVTNLLKILDERKKLNKIKYTIKIIKNIPCRAGLGGGSINSGTILKYFIKKKIIKCNKKEVLEISKKIGSDVIFGLQDKKTILLSKKNIINSNKKVGLHIIISKPHFGCSTALIYKKLKKFNRNSLNGKIKKNLKVENLIKLKNDLENPAFKIYPSLSNLKNFMNTLKDVKFVRMTGSGSCMIAYFNSKKSSINAIKIMKKKYKNYLSILSKTI